MSYGPVSKADRDCCSLLCRHRTTRYLETSSKCAQGNSVPNHSENKRRRINQPTIAKVLVVQCSSARKKETAYAPSPQNPPYSSAVNLATDLTRHGIEISNRSTIRYLHRAGFSNLLPRRVPFITEAHVTKRLEWCQRRRHDSWRNTIFTDECTFQLFRNSLRIWVPADSDAVSSAPKNGQKLNV